MTVPTIGVFVPTAGRLSLLNALQSFTQQRLLPGDRMLVVSDGPQPRVETLAARFPQVMSIITPQTNDWGHSQCNEAIAGGHLKTDLIMGMDDDTILLPRAFEVIRAAYFGDAMAFHHWTTPWSIAPRDGWDGHCLVTPNHPERIGRFRPVYSGDQAYVLETQSYWKGHFRRRTEIITRHRPRGWLWYWEVREPAQVEAMRQIRNECRQYMTHSQREITPEQQEAWWRGLDHDNTLAYLFTEPEKDEDYVGYGLVRRIDGKMNVSYGLRSSARGRGLGTEMVQFILDACQGDAWGDLLESNTAIWHIDQKLGFVELSRTDGVITCHRPWPIQ